MFKGLNFNCRRQRRAEHMLQEVDSILEKNNDLYFEKPCVGETRILKNELQKKLQ